MAGFKTGTAQGLASGKEIGAQMILAELHSLGKIDVRALNAEINNDEVKKSSNPE